MEDTICFLSDFSERIIKLMPQALPMQDAVPAAAATSRCMWRENITISMLFLFRFLNSFLLSLLPVPTAQAFLKRPIRWVSALCAKAPPPPIPMSFRFCRTTTAEDAPNAARYSAATTVSVPIAAKLSDDINLLKSALAVCQS